MPRQTNQTSGIQFPDGFNLAIDSGDGFEDVGLLEGGGTATMSWDDFYYDAGNYEGLVDKAKNPMFTISPSALLNWEPATIARCFPGIMEKNVAASPSAGFDVSYAGTTNQVTLTRVNIRMAHFPEEKESYTMSSSITAVADVSNNQMLTMPLSNLTDVLTQSATLIDGFIFSSGMSEVSFADRDLVANRGNFYTDATNMYFIVEASTYIDPAAANTVFDGTVVQFYDTVDWIFTFYNSKIEAGATFNLKGVNEDGLDGFTVSFTNRPDPANSYRLFNFFKET